MSDIDRRGGLFPALLKHWRRQRGLSQLDLALVAGVSARHVSFLETGRSVPSAEMVLQLATALGAPLRHINEMLRVAGHDPIYDERQDALPDSVIDALALMKHHHEPFPLIVVDRTYRVLDLNRSALSLMAALFGTDLPGTDPSSDGELNLARLTLDPSGAHPFIANIDAIGPQLLRRIQREVLADPGDHRLAALLDELLALPTVAEDWRHIDLSVPADPVLVLHLRKDGLDLRFLVAVTTFQAPQNVVVEGLRIETWFPCDAATAELCRQISVSG